jgi:hypothetical protein
VPNADHVPQNCVEKKQQDRAAHSTQGYVAAYDVVFLENISTFTGACPRGTDECIARV